MTNVVFSTEYWRRCSSCKNPIGYSAKHYVCSVSTCTRKRTGYVFCSVHCWERHLPGARHRDAAAIEAHSPTLEAWRADLESDSSITIVKPGESVPASTPNASATAETRAPQRVIAKPQAAAPTFARGSAKDPLEQEILVVASKLKAYIKARADMNTSDAVMERLSFKLRRLADQAIDKARAEGRKTVLDRDVE